MTAAALTPAELAELGELLRFPSISADPARAGDVRAAAEWLAALLRRGGEARVVERAGRPIVDAVVRASGGDAPTVLCYGHFDVQSPAPLELWDGDPFEP